MNHEDQLRFWAKVDSAGGYDACWPWLGCVNPQTGYGQHSIPKAVQVEWGGQRTVTAAVISCSLIHGPRPTGMHVLHSCDNRPCCNPAHLRWGTQTENNREAWVRGGQQSGERHHQARLTDVQVAEVVARAKAGERVTDLAAEYGTDQSTLWAWMRGEGRFQTLCATTEAGRIPIESVVAIKAVA